MKSKYVVTALLAVVLTSFGVSANAATTYTSDPSLVDFTNSVSSYAVLSDFSSGDVSSPYATTTATLDLGLRVYNGTLTGTGLDPSNNWVLASFSGPVSTVLVFPNIDHFGAAYDGFQYQIYGTNDLSGAWTPLFDATSVSGSSEPFTLGTFTGIAPLVVNNVLTPGAGPGGTVGYEALFDFGAAYQYYAFGTSTVGIDSGNTEQELSAVATTTPEPASLLLVGTGIAGFLARRRRLNAK